MAYEKRLCVLRQIRKGFSADGAPLSGAICAERMGETLTLTLRLIGLAPLREGRYALAVKIKKQAYVFDISGNGTLKAEKCPSLCDGFSALLCFLRGEAEGIAFGSCGAQTDGIESLLNLFSQPQERRRKKQPTESAYSEERKRGLPSPLPPTQVPGAPNPQVPLAPTPPTEWEDGKQSPPTGNRSGRENSARFEEESSPYNGQEHSTRFTGGRYGARENTEYPAGQYGKTEKPLCFSEEFYADGSLSRQQPTSGENGQEYSTCSTDRSARGDGENSTRHATGDQGQENPTHITEATVHGGRVARSVQQTEYCDEAIAQDNYFLRGEKYERASHEDEETAPCRQGEGAQKADGKPPCGNEADGAVPSKPSRSALTYYYEVREKLLSAFAKYPKDTRLCNVFPYSEWVNTGKGLLGVIYQGGIPSLLCLAHPKEGEEVKEKDGYIFVPSSPFCEEEGFYILFQSADSGEIVRIAEG